VLLLLLDFQPYELKLELGLLKDFFFNMNNLKIFLLKKNQEKFSHIEVQKIPELKNFITKEYQTKRGVL